MELAYAVNVALLLSSMPLLTSAELRTGRGEFGVGRRERHGGAGAVGRGAGHRAAGGGGPASPLIDDRVITVRVVYVRT